MRPTEGDPDATLEFGAARWKRMQRFWQLLFMLCLLVGSWYGMMAVHELGHVLGVIWTGGTVQRVVLHPGVISRTDVAPNPRPGVVAWSGPLVGCALPALLPIVMPRRWLASRAMAMFFAGFCLVANGAYIGVGAWLAVGDCREMIQAGTPLWVMVSFGLVAVVCGLWIWHQTGSLHQFLRDPARVKPAWSWGMLIALGVYVVAASLLAPPA